MKIPLLDRIMMPSTRAFFREGLRTPGYSLFDALHGYVYGRWVYLYIGLGTGRHPLSKKIVRGIQTARRLLGRQAPSRPAETRPKQRSIPPPPRPGPDGLLRTGTTADTYHGKVVPLAAATQLVTVNEPIARPQPETVIPFARARNLVLEHPDHLVVLDCPCRSAREDPCLPLDVCLIVGEPFASFVAEHHPQRTRRITPEQAVAILQAEDARGHVHHAFFKDAMLDRFYAICNCCACCCGAMQMQRHGAPMLISSGYVCQVDADLCIGCESCAEYCQFGALALDQFTMAVDRERCMGCGVCVSKCAQGALGLALEPERGEPLAITG